MFDYSIAYRVNSQELELPHVKSNRKKSCSSRKNLTQNRSPKEG
nr:MAG TPA: hypothetical protein [Bacteriophage sp.]